MPGVKCKNCGHEGNVRFQRGTVLANIACAECGQCKLGVKHRPKSTTAGRTYENCALCGRRGLSHEHPSFEWEPKTQTLDQPCPAGSAACWTHEPRPANRDAYWDVMERLTAKYRGHVSDLNGFTPPTALSAALDEFATPAPAHCAVCYDHRPRATIIDSHGDFQTVEYHEFTGGLALLASCFHCHHTIVLSELERVSPNITE